MITVSLETKAYITKLNYSELPSKTLLKLDLYRITHGQCYIREEALKNYKSVTKDALANGMQVSINLRAINDPRQSVGELVISKDGKSKTGTIELDY